MKTLHTFFSSLLIVGLSALSIPSFADDTELYSQVRQVTSTGVKPNLLFIMDNSGSMNDSLTATGLDPNSACLNSTDISNVKNNTPKKMTILKDALCKVLDEAKNVNIGLARFTFDDTYGGNTPILYPVTDISAAVPANTVAYTIPISSSSDDAAEGLSDENVSLTDKTIEMTNRIGTDVLLKDTTKSIQVSVAASTDNARESLGNKTTAGTISTSELTLGANNTDGEQIVGLRFAGMQIPSGAKILASWIEFMAFNTNCNCNQPMGLTISGFDSTNTATFATSTSNISARTLTTASTIGWNNIESWTDKKVYQTPDLSEIIQAITDKSGWSSGNAIGFSFIRNPAYSATAPDNANSANRRFYGFGETGGTAPILKVVYSTDTSSSAPTTGSASVSARQLTAISQRISDSSNDAYELLGNSLVRTTMPTDYIPRKNAVIVNTDPSATAATKMALGEGQCIKDSQNYYKCVGQELVGLRFVNLNIPQNTTISSAYIELTSLYQGTSDGILASSSESLDVNIFAQDSTTPTAFTGGNFNVNTWGTAGTVNSNLTSRLPAASAPKVTWTGVPLAATLADTITTPDLASIINPILAKSDWNPNANALVFLIKPTQDPGSATSANVTSSTALKTDRVGSQVIYDYSDGTNGPARAAKLNILLGKAIKPASQKVGLRFQNVRIPSGATVKSASISFTSGVKNSSTTAKFTIQGESAGDSLAFQSQPLNISNRTKTSASVTWSSSSSGTGKMVAWDDGNVYNTPDLKTIVQEIVNRSDWCGGNNMSFIFSDATSAKTSLKNFLSYDQDPSVAPTLHVEFYAQGLPTNTCIQQTFSTNITDPNDDGVQTLTRDGIADDNSMFLTGVTSDNTLNMATTKKSGGGITKRMVGVRFQNIPIKKGTTIKKAKLYFTGSNTVEENEDATVTNAALAASASLTIQGEAGNATSFTTKSSGFTSRTKTSSVSWSIPSTGTGIWTNLGQYDTPDLKNIVQNIVNSDTWSLNGSMAFFITSDDNSSLRKAAAYEQSATLNTRLEITVDGLLGNDTSFSRTVKDLIKEEIQWMKPLLYTPTADVLYEAALYYRGNKVSGGASNRRGYGSHRVSTPLSHDKPAIFADADYDTTVTPKVALCAPDVANYPLASVCASEKIDTSTSGGNYSAPITESPATYTSPITDDPCQKSYIVLLSDGLPTKNNVAGVVIANGGNKPAKSYSACGTNTACRSFIDDIYTSDGAGMTNITCSTAAPSNLMGKCGPEIAKFLATHDNKTGVSGSIVKTHTIGMKMDSEPGGEAYLQAIATAGGGSYYRADTAESLLSAFREVVAAALTDSTSFAAPAVSVNVFNRLYHNNEIYFTFFKPSTKVAWEGNVKRYNMCTDATNPDCTPCTQAQIQQNTCKMPVLGKDGKSILDDKDAIKNDAFDVWSTLTSPDGQNVTMAGAGGVLPAPDNRNIYTNTVGDAAITLTDSANAVTVANTSLTTAMLNVATEANPTTARTDLINWIRGYADITTSKLRDWRFGDPLHSTPGVFTYGKETNGTPKTKVIVNTNEGAIRMLDGKTGVEDWMFIPRDMLKIQKNLKANETSTQHVYGIDGRPTVWVRDNNNNNVIEPTLNESVWVFTGMGRGGRNVYALQVTPDTAVPPVHKPRLMWTIFGGTTNSSQGDFTRLGQTWSTPIVTTVVYNGAPKTVLLFAGGYDATTQDTTATYQQSASMGNAIYMVDPLDGGKLLWMAGSPSNTSANLKLTGMNYPFPSDLTLIDSDKDGLVDRIYVGDTGGQLWRIDIRDVGKGYAVGGRLANIGDSTTDAGKRRFFYPPEVASFTDAKFSPYAPDIDLVLIGSGYRSHPLDMTINDRLYAFRDRQTGWLVGDSGSGKSGNAVQDTPAFLDQTVAGGSAEAVTKFFTITEDKLYNATEEVINNTASNQTTLDGAKTAIQKSLGWKVELKDATAGFIGEKALAKPLVMHSVAYYSTFVPPQPQADQTVTDACKPSFDPGTAKAYKINILTGEGTGKSEQNGGGKGDGTNNGQVVGTGIPSGPVIIFTEDGVKVFVPSEGKLNDLGEPRTDPTERVYWIEE
jgi:type IV pilus assembly protein PilY1